MAECPTLPKSRLDLAGLLKDNDYNIHQTLSHLEDCLDLDIERRDSLHAMLFRIRDTVQRAKKSLDSCEGEWWNSQLSLQHKQKKTCISLLDDLEIDSSSIQKNLSGISLKKMRSRLSSVLDSIKLLSEIGNTSEINIASLALQLLSNEVDSNETRKVSKSKVYDSFHGQFGNVPRKELDLDKSLFLLDLLEIGKRKYTRFRQQLLSNEFKLPAYHKLNGHRNCIVLSSIIQPYPIPIAPIGVKVPYAQYVRHTFLRILTTIAPPSTEDFPMRSRIADGLDGSGSDVIYNQLSTNTGTKISYFIASNQ